MSRAPKKTRIVVCGGSGRMGARILSLAAADGQFEVVASVERSGNAVAADGRTPVVRELRDVLPQADAVIDFTAPEAAIPNATLTAKMGKAFVLGTTGLTPANVTTLKKLATKIPLVFSPNMSLGVNVLFDLVREAAAKLAHYDIEIIEAHHRLKKDAPSGTALRLAEVAAEASQRSSKDFVYGRQGLVGERKSKEIGVLAVRAGDIVGDHTVLISAPGERLELIHRAHSRDAFAAGALRAAAWATGRKAGFYSMKDVLGI